MVRRSNICNINSFNYRHLLSDYWVPGRFQGTRNPYGGQTLRYSYGPAPCCSRLCIIPPLECGWDLRLAPNQSRAQVTGQESHDYVMLCKTRSC